MAGNSLDFDFQPGDPATSILLLFVDGAQYSAHQIAELTAQEPAESARWASILAALRLLDGDGHGAYRPGLALRANAVLLDPVGNRSARTDVLTALAAIGGRARIGVLHPSGVSYLEKSAGGADRFGFTAAGSMPASGSALGQVLLAYRGDGEADGWGMGSGPADVHLRDELALALSVVRLSGVAITRGGSTPLDVAVPVIGPNGVVQIAIEVPARGFDDADDAVLEELRLLAEQLSRQLPESDRPATDRR